MKETNNKLPEVNKKGIKIKIKKAIFILLSSIGIATLPTDYMSHKEVSKEVETTTDKEKRESFAETLKTMYNGGKEINEIINQKIVDEIIENRR